MEEQGGEGQAEFSFRVTMRQTIIQSDHQPRFHSEWPTAIFSFRVTNNHILIQSDHEPHSHWIITEQLGGGLRQSNTIMMNQFARYILKYGLLLRVIYQYEHTTPIKRCIHVWNGYLGFSRCEYLGLVTIINARVVLILFWNWDRLKGTAIHDIVLDTVVLYSFVFSNQSQTLDPFLFHKYHISCMS